MNLAELNFVLYYADFLALKSCSRTVTDNCKYYFVHGVPMNSAYLIDLQPFFDTKDPFYKQAESELATIKSSFGDDGVASFLEDICMLRARGVVNAIQMLKYIHAYSTRQERRQSFIDYYKWKDEQKYTLTVEDELGKPKQIECSMYVAHYNKRFNK